MSCERAGELLYDHVEGRLDDATSASLHEHLARCPGCRAEAGSLAEVWNGLGKIEPERATAGMRSRFYEMLSAYERGADARPARRGFAEWLHGWWPQQPMPQVGLALGALLVGLWAGPRLPSGGGHRAELDALRTEMKEMARTVTLSLLQHPSASERLRAVSLSERTPEDTGVTQALLQAITGDPSVNVRLAALEVLAEMVQQPEVRSGLLDAFPRQEVPTMQVAMAEVLVAMGGPRSREAIEEMLHRDGLPSAVRQYLENTLTEGDRT